MTRWRITVEYEGTGFVGWQRQDNGPSIQEAIETAIEQFSGESPRVFGAGRTDAGVHALGQVAHLDLAKEITTDSVADALNAHLRPLPIAIRDAAVAKPDFDARRSAIGRSYRYRIINRRAPLTVDRNRAWLIQPPLDHEAMGRAAARLIGNHDFTTFRASLCQAQSPIKTLDRLDVRRDGDEILVDAHARSFLHRQVRNIVGTLRLVGEGKWTPDDVSQALEARDRAQGGATAPACGLYFMAVRYPADAWPSASAGAADECAGARLGKGF